MQLLRLLFVLTLVLLLGVVLAPAPARARSAALAAGQPDATSTAGGQVVYIGFDGTFQPTGWVPMKVRVSPPGGETGLYQIRVHQRDLDSDQVIYQRTVTLTGGMPNQEFWTYFKPQPVEGGLPANDTGEMRKRLRVVLADEQGRELAQLGVPVNIVPLYSGNDSGSGNTGRGKRLILRVSDTGGNIHGFGEYQPDRGVGMAEDRRGTIGMTEENLFVTVPTDALPDRWIGYDSVDTILWQDADPTILTQGGGERMIALRQWVRSGGKLVVGARSDWATLEPFFDVLPVTPASAVERQDLAPLLGIIRASERRGRVAPEPWAAAQGPFRYIVGQPKPDAIVENWFSYDQPNPLGGSSEGTAPLVARRAEGFGSVTWMALDMTNREVGGQPNRRPQGWPIIWNHLLGLGDTPFINPDDSARRDYAARETKDLGFALLPGSRLAGRSVALVTVAMVFFIAYWLIAGPGLYFYLASKRRTPLSWFFFGAAAVIATFVTLGVVKLILRGPPDLRHVSVARQGPVAPQVVHCEMGLYIPEDGVQRLVIDGGAAGAPPTLSGFGVDPDHHRGAGGRSNPISYVINLDPPTEDNAEDVEGSATVVDIPYRSTLKKLEADWVGPIAKGIDGRPRLIEGSGFCEGRLLNVTGQNLVNVHIAFRRPNPTGAYDVWLIYLPSWQNGQSIESLSNLLAPEEGPRMPIVDAGPRSPSPTQAVYGRISQDWPLFWYRPPLRSSIMSTPTDVVDDWNDRVRRSPAMLSFFNLLPPMASTTGNNDATILLRRGAHELDISAAVVAGNMVIIAEADEVPLPLPLEVDGDPVEGAGRIIYQFVLPLDRTVFDDLERRPPAEEEDADAATQPATQPAPPDPEDPEPE